MRGSAHQSLSPPPPILAALARNIPTRNIEWSCDPGFFRILLGSHDSLRGLLSVTKRQRTDSAVSLLHLHSRETFPRVASRGNTMKCLRLLKHALFDL